MASLDKRENGKTRNLLYITLLAVTISFAYSQITFAACVGGPTVFTCNTNPPNPDPDGVQQNGNNADLTVNVLPGAAIDTSLQPGLFLDGIRTGNGNDVISIVNASVTGQNEGINARGGNNQITLTNSSVAALSNSAIRAGVGADNNILNINNSIVTSVDDRLISTNVGDDVVNVTNSELISLTASGHVNAIRTSAGNDEVSLEKSIIQSGRSGTGVPTIIDLSDGDDTLTIGTGVVLQAIRDGGVITNGIIKCGSDFDTIIFAMDVFEDKVALISSQIALKNPAGDSITINNLFYEWEDCELLVSELVGVRDLRPIPTLSEWGLIAMAGVLGIVGFMVMRRRKVTA